MSIQLSIHMILLELVFGGILMEYDDNNLEKEGLEKFGEKETVDKDILSDNYYETLEDDTIDYPEEEFRCYRMAPCCMNNIPAYYPRCYPTMYRQEKMSSPTSLYPESMYRQDDLLPLVLLGLGAYALGGYDHYDYYPPHYYYNYSPYYDNYYPYYEPYYNHNYHHRDDENF